MAIYGIGAKIDEIDVFGDFINKSIACIGYEKADASSIYEMFRRIKIGDIIYIKSFAFRKLNIKAIGFVTGVTIKEYENLGYGRQAKWLYDMTKRENWMELELTDAEYKNNVYNNSLYEEYSRRIINKIINHFFD